MSRCYSFETIWHLDAPIEHVWNAIVTVERWPEWWPSVKAVHSLELGSPEGLGAVNRFVWRGLLPYTLTFDMRVTEILWHHRIVGVATGELHGHGICALQFNGRATRVQYDWNVGTTKAWMNILAPVLTPAFRWNHDYVMNEGGRRLAEQLRCRLLPGDQDHQTEA